MRAILMVLVAFGAGYATALMLNEPALDALMPGSSTTANQDQVEQERVAGNARSSGREVFQTDGRGHVVTRAHIDGRDMEVMVDTGASAVVLRESDARRAGYRLQDSDFTVRVSTANGIAYAAPITLREIEIGSIRVRNVPALVNRDHQLGTNLLGMTFLSRLEGMRFEGRDLILEN